MLLILSMKSFPGESDVLLLSCPFVLTNKLKLNLVIQRGSVLLVLITRVSERWEILSDFEMINVCHIAIVYYLSPRASPRCPVSVDPGHLALSRPQPCDAAFACTKTQPSRGNSPYGQGFTLFAESSRLVSILSRLLLGLGRDSIASIETS